MSAAAPDAATEVPLASEAQASYTVAVRTLCDFTAKRGDLDLRFTPSPSAQEGIAGHQWVCARRGPTYQAELSLSGRCGALEVRGRADGFDAPANRLEEIKTFKGSLALMPDNHRHLHWAQLKVYGALLCAQQGLTEVNLALVYFDVRSQQETVLHEQHTAADLQRFFTEQCERFMAWAVQEDGHRKGRDLALAALRFPHAEFRAGQRDLAEAVYKAAASGRCLLAQAPTGIGKTIGTVFPLLKACPGHQLDKIFFLCAKTSGRALALRALQTLAPCSGTREPATLRVLELVARHTACEHPDRACHGESCPLARGFYDRLPAARSAALARGQLDRATVREVALDHGLCPYYLGQELARWCDVVVGDYNHYFDVHAMLFSLTQAHQWRVGVLVDEAHNLIERGRRMYSAELQQRRLDEVRRAAPASLSRALNRLHRAWLALNRTHGGEHMVLETLPARWLGALQELSTALGEHVTDHPEPAGSTLTSFYFDTLHFMRLAEQLDEHTVCDLSHTPNAAGRAPLRSTVSIRNVMPAPFLKPRFAAARSTALFSATLQPHGFCRDILGLPADTPWIDVASPFHADQLQVRVSRHISTRYRDRGASLQAMVDVMAAQYAELPGNYLAFFSSHDYLAEVVARFEACHADVPVWKQSRGMGEDAQRAFLERFTVTGQGIGFAVLGGSFAEGIDLPGQRLIGAFIATLGMPQVNPVNEQMRQRLDRLLGAGHDCTYLYPGLHKVVQAAGRVIRTVADQGVVHLLDDRYQRPAVRQLLPRWWKVA
ncbi:MAG: ATP-dependent DNA helicase [Pseudomonadota bacterium]